MRARLAAVLVAIMTGALTLAIPATANAVPYSCDQQGQIKRYYCADVTGVPAGSTLPLRQKAAIDAPEVTGTSHQNGDSLVLSCWATSPITESVDSDSYWFSVFDPKQPDLVGYVNDAYLTTGNSSDWLDVVGECSGNESPPTTGTPYDCEHAGGEDHAVCAKVTGVSDLTLLHLLEHPAVNAAHLTDYSYYSDGSELAFVCWTKQPTQLVDGDPYWFKVFNPNERRDEGYVNDFYLATGTLADWQPKVTEQCPDSAAPPATVTQVNAGHDPHDPDQYCPQVNEAPDLQPLKLRVRDVTVTSDNEIKTQDEGVQQLGTVQNCLVRQSTSTTTGVVFSRSHIKLANNPKWDVTSRVLGVVTTVSRDLAARTGSFTTVYPPGQAGCQPQACRSETYFLTRASGGPVTGHTGFVQRRSDYDFESRPISTPYCNGRYRLNTVKLASDPGGDNFETQRSLTPQETVTYGQAGWMPAPGTRDFRGVTFAWTNTKTFDATMWSAEARDRVALREENAGAQVEVQFRIDNGTTASTRIVDVLTPDGTAIEVKTGGATASVDTKLQQQINNDVALRAAANSGVKKVEWHFFANPTDPTNVGPSAAVKRALDKASIPYVVDNAGTLCQN